MHINPYSIELSTSLVGGLPGLRSLKYKIPRHITFEASLPREESGTIFKRRLCDPFWAATGRQI
jgi:long-chain acyl-CoA synthetase